MRKLLVALLCACTLSVQAGTGLETWWDYGIIGDVGSRAQVRILQQYQFEHGFDSLFSFCSENILLFKFAS